MGKSCDPLYMRLSQAISDHETPERKVKNGIDKCNTLPTMVDKKAWDKCQNACS